LSRRNWNAEDCTTLVSIIGKHRAWPAAMAAIKAHDDFGQDMTADMVSSAFRRYGLAQPGAYLAKLPDLDYGDEVTCPNLENQAPVTGYSRDTQPAPKEPESESLRVFIIPDVHAPYHDERAFDTALLGGRRWLEQVPRERRVVLIQGDFIDCLQVSFYPKTPGRGADMPHEIEVANELLGRVMNLDAGRTVYTVGNHSQRVERYIVERAAALFGLVSLRDLLHIGERGIEWIPYRDHTFIGDALCTHDLGFVGKYATMRSAESAGCSTLTGHTHRISVQHHADAHGRQTVSASFGWLGRFDKIDYMHRAKFTREWSHGFGTGTVDSTGKLHVVAHAITEGRTVVDGYELAA
jgi:hypothetical protein